MNKSLLFIPDISGFTKFVQKTEVEHSQHVIAELLEILIDANNEDFQLAEVEGDALFFYKEGELPTLEQLLAQAEKMFNAFYSHLKLMEKNRICPCHACATAPNLDLKIISHSGELQFITVKDHRKPFGTHVIEAHRLMKNSIKSEKYLLMSKLLAEDIKLSGNSPNRFFNFEQGKDKYDGAEVEYLYSELNKKELKLEPFVHAEQLHFPAPPPLFFEKTFSTPAEELLEFITNYSYRHHWTKGVDEFEYNEKEVTKVGTPHTCVINGKDLNFIVVTKKGKPGELVYGELTTSPSPVDELYQFFIVSPLNDNSCTLKVEIYWKVKSPFKKIIIALFVKKILRKNTEAALENLFRFVQSTIKT